jgi:hypothetical protein
MVRKFQRCYCVLLVQPSNLSSLAVKAIKIIFPNYTCTQIQKSKFCGPCLKPLLITILMCSVPLHSHQKDERAKPGNLLTNDALSLSLQQSVSHFSKDFSLPSTLLLYFLSLSRRFLPRHVAIHYSQIIIYSSLFILIANSDATYIVVRTK